MGMPRRLRFEKGEKVQVASGMFKSMEGVIAETVSPTNRVTVELTIFGRVISVELEQWELEPAKE
jgi:transcription antitermination factor NusG